MNVYLFCIFSHINQVQCRQQYNLAATERRDEALEYVQGEAKAYNAFPSLVFVQCKQ